jgi:hypothetical protein
MRTNNLLAVIAVAASGCSSAWELKETKNEMDDTVRYSVFTKSDREVKFKDQDPFNPLLSVTVERGATTVRFAPGDVIAFSDFRNGRQLGSVKVRLDDDERRLPTRTASRPTWRGTASSPRCSPTRR